MLSEIERRAAADVGAEGHKIRGYAMVFNTLSADLGGFRELIMPEAVDRTLREGLDVRALVDHDPSKVLGRTKAGTLTLAKDAHGLRAEIDPPDTNAGRDILALVSAATWPACRSRLPSFGRRRAFERRDGGHVRIVSDMIITDVSIVTFPAYARRMSPSRSGRCRRFRRSKDSELTGCDST